MNSNRILIVDQDATFIQTVSNYFKSIGIEVFSTGDGIEGYRMAKDVKPGVLIQNSAYVQCRVPDWRIRTTEPLDKYKGPKIPENSVWKIL